MGHQYATGSYLPNLGENQGIEEIAANITEEEIRIVAGLEEKEGTGMYNGEDIIDGFNEYIENGDTNSSLVSAENLVSAVYKAGLKGLGNLERFLYSDVDGVGEFRFHAEGQYKRVHRDRDGEVALLEGRDQQYNIDGQNALLNTLKDNYESLEAADNVEPVSNEEPYVIRLDDEKPVLWMQFFDRMVPISELRDDQMDLISDLVENASEEMQEMISDGDFQTLQPDDFNYGESERAEEHFYVDEEDLDDLEQVEELMISDLGETEPSFGDSGQSDFIH